MPEDNSRITLNKGYTKNGFAEKVFHIHLRLSGGRDEIYFRNYLNSHREVAKMYEELNGMATKIWEI